MHGVGAAGGVDPLVAIVRAALSRHSHRPGVVIADDSRLDGTVGLDSFALLNALLDVEDELGVVVPPERLAGVREMRFADLVALLAATEPPASAPLATGLAP